jgi:uncharacterized protein YceH (UPF0502 family)
MSSPTEAAPAASPTWPILSMDERRVLGVLVEKQKTTPDTYPLSLNALVTACNQKSNREPVLNLSDADAEDALTSCQKKGLAIKITGGRVERWRHALYDSWKVDKVELAVLAELLLRGSQTEGELRGHASRMEPIADLDALRNVLRPMAERTLVVWLGEPGKRGTTITHGFHAPADLERLQSAVPTAASSGATESSVRSPEPPREDELAVLRQTLQQVQQAIAELQQRVQALEAKGSVQ